MKNYFYLIWFLCIAAGQSACGEKVSSQKKLTPAAALDHYATRFVELHKSDVHGHSAPLQMLEYPLSYGTQFFTTVPAMLTTAEKLSYEKNIAITEKWQQMYCTDEFLAQLREMGVAIASAQLIDSSTGEKHSLAMCVATQPESPQQKTADITPSFSLASLDAGKVDPQFHGVPPSVLVSALERLTEMKKGEFESTKTFSERRDALLAKNRIDGYGIDNLFPFVVDVGKYSSCLNGIMYGYNADTSKAALYLSAWPERLGDNDYTYASYSDTPKYDTLELARDYQKDRSYVGVNAFGVKEKVTEVNGVIFVAATKRVSYIQGPRTLSCVEKKPVFVFQMDATTAARELPSLRAIIVLKLNRPYLLYSYYHNEPTRDDPFETKVQTKAIFGDVVKIVVYSGINGKIIAQFPLAQHK